MRLLKSFLVVGFILTLNSFCSAQNKMTINGVIKNYPFDVLFVRGDTPKSQVFFDDTIKVVNGKFSYSKEIEGAVNYSFVAANMLSKFTIYAGNETIEVNADYNTMKEPLIKGSKANDDNIFLYQKYGDLFSEIIVSNNNVYGTNDKEQKKVYNKQLSDVKNKLLSAMVTDAELKDNLAVPFHIYNYIDFSDYDFSEGILKKLSKKQCDVIYSKHMQMVIKRAKGTVINAKAYDFKLYDLKNKEYRLSDFKGKYVLIEFSASWCGWCKKEIPYIEQVYEYGKDRGLVVITVNLDTERELWEKDSNVPWLTLSDLKAFESETTKGYNVGGIPQLYLIDKSGRIINKDLRGDDLVNYVKQILN